MTRNPPPAGCSMLTGGNLLPNRAFLTLITSSEVYQHRRSVPVLGGHISTRLRVHGCTSSIPNLHRVDDSAQRFPFRGDLGSVSLPQPPKTRGTRHAEVAWVHGQTRPTRASLRRAAHHLPRQAARWHRPRRCRPPRGPSHPRRGRTG